MSTRPGQFHIAPGESPLAPAITRRLIENSADDHRPPPASPTPSHTSANANSTSSGSSPAASQTRKSQPTPKISDTTVKSHVARILAKLNLRDRVQTVVFAYESVIRPGNIN